MENTEFLVWLDAWIAEIPSVSTRELLEPNPQQVAVLVVDLVNGFCTVGPLASPRVQALADPVATLLTDCQAHGLPHLLLAEDCHPADSPEFQAFPPHCVEETVESQTIPELSALPFAAHLVHFPKGSLSVGLEPEFASWVHDHPEVDRWLVVGDCTDLCVQQAALWLRLEANRTRVERDVVVAANLTDTYDLPISVAQSIGAFPHPGDLMHRLALYQLALNGVRVVQVAR